VSRARTSGEDVILAAKDRVIAPVRLQIRDSSLTWRTITNLSGTGFSGLNFLKSCSCSDDVDAATWTGVVNLAASIKTSPSTRISIAPDVTASPINSPDPLIDGMRRIRWYDTTGRIGVAGTEHLMFDGYIVDFDQQGNDLALQVADLGHDLVVAQIADKRVYGSDTGVLIQDVIQQILDDNMGTGAYTLVVDSAIVSAGVMVRKFEQDRVHVMDAIRSLAQNTIGANCRFMWNDSDAMELRLFMPPRSKTTADFTFNADNYERNPRWRRNTSDIRNFGRLYYADRNKGNAVVFVESFVDASITRYKPRYFEFVEDAVKNIDTQVEAQDMLDKAIADLSTPKAEKSFTTQLAWPFQIHDLFTMVANGDQYDVDQPQYVTKLTHNWGDAKSTRTAFETRGTVAGFYNNWLIQHGRGPRPPETDSLALVLGAAQEGTMYGDELFSDIGGIGQTNGCIWPFLFVGSGIRRIHVWGRQNAPGTLVPDWPPVSADIYKACTIERPEGKVPRGNFVWPGDATPVSTDPYNGISFWRTVIPIPTGIENDGTIRTLIIKAETWDGTFGEEQRVTGTAIDGSGSDPTGFTSLTVNRIDATTVEIVATPADTSASSIFIFRDGVNIDQIEQDAGDGGPFTWQDPELKPEKEYRYSVFRFDNGHSGPRTQITISPWGTAFGFATGTPTLDFSFGGPKVLIDITGVPTGTTQVEVQKSKDNGQYDQWTVATRMDVADFPFKDVVAKAGQYYRLVAYDSGGAILDTCPSFFWRSPLGFTTEPG